MLNQAATPSHPIPPRPINIKETPPSLLASTLLPTLQDLWSTVEGWQETVFTIDVKRSLFYCTSPMSCMRMAASLSQLSVLACGCVALQLSPAVKYRLPAGQIPRMLLHTPPMLQLLHKHGNPTTPTPATPSPVGLLLAVVLMGECRGRDQDHLRPRELHIFPSKRRRSRGGTDSWGLSHATDTGNLGKMTNTRRRYDHDGEQLTHHPWYAVEEANQVLI